LRVVLDERYADLAAQFQRAQIAMLRNTLNKYGVIGDAARDICGEFSFDLAMILIKARSTSTATAIVRLLLHSQSNTTE
jgi:hypothetical protein